MALDVGVLLQVLFWGLYAGCIYILLATGLTLIFGVMKIVNFAHGELLMLGAYLTATVFALTGINPYSIILLTMLILGVIGIAIERTSFRPILGTGKLNEIFISLGLIYVIQNAAALIWGDERQVLTSRYFGPDCVLYYTGTAHCGIRQERNLGFPDLRSEPEW